jgi:ferredoxin
MKQERDVILINEDKCNGCGLCVPNCPEGAIQIIEGKARLISDLFCDGLGACLGHCPQGAITIERRRAEPYDEKRVMGNVAKAGPAVIKAHLEHLASHNQTEYLAQAREYLQENKIVIDETKGGTVNKNQCGCPGGREMVFGDKKAAGGDTANVKLGSELRQWPVQLQLLNPHAPYFKDADLVIVADCVPFAFADFHRRFLKDKMLIIFCPKLDQTIDQYVEKLTQLFTDNSVKSIALVHMEVPCCFGVEKIVQEALKASGKNIALKDYTISLQGEII